jgi:hypothetical protein
MIAVAAIGATAHALLARATGDPRVLAALARSLWLAVDDEVVWVGPAGGPLHPRAVHVEGAVPDGGGALRFGPRPAPWRPAPCRVPRAAALAAPARRLVAALAARDAPAGFGAVLVGRTPAFPLAGAGDRVARLAAACADDDPARAADAAVALLGLGPGLTPAGDDLVGGALFARALAPPDAAWTAAAARVVAAARTRTHPISAALLGDLARGEAYAPLHALAAGLAGGDDAGALAAARALVAIGHSSGWDLLTGLAVGVGALAGIRPASPASRTTEDPTGGPR